MSKLVKEMQMNVLKETFQDVRDMVLISPGPLKLNAISENKLRLDLRKKDIRLMLVKNTLARRVFGELGMELQDCWAGPTLVAWGSSSIANLSKELKDTLKPKDEKETFKSAVADGGQVTFKQALDLSTREEAIGRVMGLILSPGGNLLGSILGPGSQLQSQIKSLGEEKTDEESNSGEPAS